jgi:predicted ArsR family transcriptional regulator
MSKEDSKYAYLPKHQKKIVFSLAKHGAMTMSETNRKLQGENTSTTRAFHDLESKGMVKKTDKMPYRGREFDKYWLTERGMAYALLNSDVKSNVIKEHALSFDKTQEIYFDLRAISPNIANILDRMLLLVGKITTEDLAKQMLPEVISLKPNENERFRAIIKKSKEFFDFYKARIRNMKKFVETEAKELGV